jgi:hypothetical protein
LGRCGPGFALAGRAKAPVSTCFAFFVPEQPEAAVSADVFASSDSDFSSLMANAVRAVQKFNYFSVSVREMKL